MANLGVSLGLTTPGFNLLSSPEIDPPVFTITFNSSDRPPTNVVCFRDGVNLTISDSDISRVGVSLFDSIVVNVTVTFRIREAGNYTCTVTSSKGDSSTTMPLAITGIH